MTTVTVIIALLFEILPTFLIGSNVPTIASVKPYTPLELAGRDVYIAEGCFNCHSQMIRPFRHETERYGEYSKPGEFAYDHPFLWGSRRIGPDLARQDGKYPSLWHVRHLDDPRVITQKSIMPAYATRPMRLTRRALSADAMSKDGSPERRRNCTHPGRQKIDRGRSRGQRPGLTSRAEEARSRAPTSAARAEAGQVDVNVVDIPLEAVLAEVNEMLSSQLGEKWITVEREGCSAAVRAGPERLRQILLNL